MKKTVSLLLIAIMLLGVSSAMAIPGDAAIGSHQSLGDQGGVRSAVIDAANWHGIVIDQSAMDAMGLKFSAKGRFTDNLTRWAGFQWRLGEDSSKGRTSDVPKVTSLGQYAADLVYAYFKKWHPVAIGTTLPVDGTYGMYASHLADNLNLVFIYAGIHDVTITAPASWKTDTEITYDEVYAAIVTAINKLTYRQFADLFAMVK